MYMNSMHTNAASHSEEEVSVIQSISVWGLTLDSADRASRAGC